MDKKSGDIPERTIEEWVKEVVDKAPPLSPEQRDKLALLLRPFPFTGGENDRKIKDNP